MAVVEDHQALPSSGAMPMSVADRVLEGELELEGRDGVCDRLRTLSFAHRLHGSFGPPQQAMERPISPALEEEEEEDPLVCKAASIRRRASRQPACKRRLLADYEKELTFHPRLNSTSVKIVSRNSKSSLPVVTRLFESHDCSAEALQQLQAMRDAELTFQPRLNALSVKLAQERAPRYQELQTKMAEMTAMKVAEVYSQYTFKPQVSERSMQIAENLGTNFLTRQQLHLERRQKMSEVYKSPPRSLCRPKRLLRLKSLPNTCSAATSTASTQQLTPLLESTSKQQASSELLCPFPNGSTTPLLTASLPSTPPPSSTKSPLTSWSQAKPGSHRKTSNKAKSPGKKQADSPVSVDSPGKGRTVKAKGKLSPGKHSSELPCTGSRYESLPEPDKMKRARVLAERAIRTKKTFLVSGGYGPVRSSLRRRGWVEINYRGARDHTHRPCPQGTDQDSDSSDSEDDLDASDLCDLQEEGEGEGQGDEEEYCMVSRLLRYAVPHLVWTLKTERWRYNSLRKEQMANHFIRAGSFTTKVGLCANLKNLRWYGDTDSNSFFPRCYRVECEEEKQAFVDDFRFTAALSLLKLLLKKCHVSPSPPSPSPPSSPPSSPSQAHPPPINAPPADQQERTIPSNADEKGVGRGGGGGRGGGMGRGRGPVVPEAVVQLALQVCVEHINSMEHKDIEDKAVTHHLSGDEWSVLLQHFYNATASLKSCQFACGADVVSQADATLAKISECYPQFNIDGSSNIWIIKPGALSRGRGVICKDQLEDILKLVSCNASRWVVQKYIECPLLIHKTKFDIRQWFLVTDWNPLTMWMYKDCYLRFSSQPFSLRNLDQSIHLCNNCVQKHYRVSPTRHTHLPQDNMWDSCDFKQHLSLLGAEDKWDSVIYPGMKKALIHVLQVTQDEVDQRKNSFELYGADFMIDENLSPWLLEINSSPTMERSTAITTRMCRQVLVDTIKVVVDRREDKTCDTGRFELAYKQPKFDTQSYFGLHLCVHGLAIRKPNR